MPSVQKHSRFWLPRSTSEQGSSRTHSLAIVPIVQAAPCLHCVTQKVQLVCRVLQLAHDGLRMKDFVAESSISMTQTLVTRLSIKNKVNSLRWFPLQGYLNNVNLLTKVRYSMERQVKAVGCRSTPRVDSRDLEVKGAQESSARYKTLFDITRRTILALQIFN